MWSQLPDNVFKQVCQCLREPSDLISLALSCIHFKKTAYDEQLWRSRCQFRNIHSLEGSPMLSYRRLYGDFLHKYGFLHGYWTADHCLTGAILKIEVSNQGYTVSVLVPISMDLPLVSVELLQGMLTEQGTLEYRFPERLSDTLSEMLIPDFALQKRDEENTIHCQFEFTLYAVQATTKLREIFSRVKFGRNEAELRNMVLLQFANSVVLNIDITDSTDMNATNTLMKRGIFRRIDMECDAVIPLLVVDSLQEERYFDQPFELLWEFEAIAPIPSQPVVRAPMPIFSHFLEGFWLGTYGPHGIEVLQCEVSRSPNIVQFVKLLGDRNVPSGQFSIRFKPQHLSLYKDGQQRLSTFRDWDIQRDLPEEVTENLLIQYLCPCELQIANYLYRFPKIIPGILFVFSNDKVGVFWGELNLFSLFQRVVRN
eukprot:TRINITY_DN10154_c0_g1_i2.p2 TRINITY_DN10154_c0_g1~~TRINITY_DN10154_c0_g1_i2.p2  ORF type:complete len:426 (-),score=11.60 TRINITY_DN10154_c0_g1_i2:3572-4849(-)